MHYVTGSQLAFGLRLGLDVAGKSVGEALAMIEDLVERDFLLKEDLGAPTPKQIDFAAKFQRDISGATRRVGSAVINDLMTELNHEAIKRGKLTPGVVWSKHDALKQKLPSPPRLDSPHPSSMRTRAADRLLLGMGVAAPEVRA
jgi:hypothetical protein